MKIKVLFIAGILLIVAAILIYVHPWQPNADDFTTWNVTLVGADGQQKVLSYDEIKAMPAYTGHGGFFTTVGVVNGPYQGKGIPIKDLCELVGGITPSDIVMLSASDGYSTVLDFDHVIGEFITYEPKTLKEVPHGELKPILMYEQDGRSLTQDEGQPLRIAVVGTEELLTEGLYWTKWVNKIEVIKTRLPADSEGQ